MGPTLPEAFCELKSLTLLDIRANRLESLPAKLGELTQLKVQTPACLPNASAAGHAFSAIRVPRIVLLCMTFFYLDQLT